MVQDRGAAVIVPMYNEAEVVGDVVADLRTEFPLVVCVDAGSTDGSAARARAAGATVLMHRVNLGQGGALQTGLDFLRERTDMAHAVTFDADGQHRLCDAVAMVEHAQAYQGLYFVLMGRLSPLDGIGPKEIRLDRLLKRATDGAVKEVILATNFTNEGEATAHYIGELMTARGLIVSRLARGVPVGGELEYVDPGTLAQALRERRPVSAE